MLQWFCFAESFGGLLRLITRDEPSSRSSSHENGGCALMTCCWLLSRSFTCNVQHFSCRIRHGQPRCTAVKRRVQVLFGTECFLQRQWRTRWSHCCLMHLHYIAAPLLNRGSLPVVLSSACTGECHCACATDATKVCSGRFRVCLRPGFYLLRMMRLALREIY
jgi:hypothetical protein